MFNQHVGGCLIFSAYNYTYIKTQCLEEHLSHQSVVDNLCRAAAQWLRVNPFLAVLVMTLGIYSFVVL